MHRRQLAVELEEALLKIDDLAAKVERIEKTLNTLKASVWNMEVRGAGFVPNIPPGEFQAVGASFEVTNDR